MAPRAYHYRWEWQLQASPEALWPLVADTNRFNRDTGLPVLDRRLDQGGKLPNARHRLRLTRLGVPIEWEEEPFEWVRPQRFGVQRRYLRGPVAEMRVLTELAPRPDGGSHLVYQVWIRPRTLVGHLAIPFQVGLLSRRSFGEAFRRYDRTLASGGSALTLPASVHLAPGGAARLAAFRAMLEERGQEPQAVARLAETIEHADDLVVAHLRPYGLAEAWGLPRRAVLELCLQATRVGLLTLQWDLLCPLCRGAQASPPTLGGVRAEVHCDTCNIDFNVNFDRSVEVTFRPNPAVRAIEVGAFCVGGPQVTPHIAAQQLLPAGEEREVALALEAGRYRLRAFGRAGGQLLSAQPGGPARATLRVGQAGWPNDEAVVGTAPTLRLRNETAGEQLLILERMAWSDQAATAAEVTALQLFRDLFASEALRPGERIEVGSLTVLFTDLRGSTKLYRQIGDAPAFGRVMDHFDVLRAAIAEEEGALVKTIGDAVMAVFRRPVAALRAMLRAQAQLANPPDGGMPLTLKAGIHHGPCIAVTLNERLDYFGSTVNTAARLEGLSSGGDVIISSAVLADPEVRALLDDGGSALDFEPFETALKGFDEERFDLWRVRARRSPSPSDVVSTHAPLERPPA